MVGAWFDAVLAAGLVLVAWRCLRVPDGFTAVVLFIAFGLLMALAWARLDAPDVALAEAAIGAGLTGALLLDALGHIAGKRQDGLIVDRLAGPQPTRAWRLVLGAAALGATGLLAGAVGTLPRPSDSAGAQILENLTTHPVDNAVTAVLLDYRAYDTFLEMGVLALAGLGALLLRAQHAGPALREPPVRTSSLLPRLTALLVPFMVLVAVYLYWAGTAHSGGAFPAGAMLAAAGVLLHLGGRGHGWATDGLAARGVLALGMAAFLLAGAITLGGGLAFLEWGGAWAYAAILALEGVLTIAIGGTLALLYAAAVAGPPPDRSPP